MIKYSIAVFFALALSTQTAGQGLSIKFNYPETRTEAFDTTIFNIKISDPFFWMSRKLNEQEMLQFSKKQGEFARTILDSIPGSVLLENELGNLFAEMQDKEDIWNVQAVSGRIYYYRDIPGEGPTLCRRANLNATEEKILNKVIINDIAYSIRKRVFAYQSPLLALMLTEDGEANPHIRIYHIEKKEFLPDSIGPVMFNDSRGVSMAWSTDDSFLFYSQAPFSNVLAEKYYNGCIMQHLLGTNQSEDVPVFGNQQHNHIILPPEETPYVYTFPNSPYIMIRIRSAWKDSYAYTVHQSELAGRETPWRLVENYNNLGDAFDVNSNWLYAATINSSGNRCIVKYDLIVLDTPKVLFSPTPDEIAGTDGSYNKAIIAGKDFLYVLMRRIGDMYIKRINLHTGEVHSIPVGRGSSFDRLQLFNENDLLFCEISPVKLDKYQWYDHVEDIVNPIPFAQNTADFSGELITEVIQMNSRDGKQIPVSIVYAKTTNLKNNNRWLIEAYGSGAASRDLYFDPYIYPWIKLGGVYAFAHVRGGGEKGNMWYKDGEFPNKHNSVNDLVDVADWLVSNQYSSPSKIIIMGASAGSILVGNAINQRPDLFAGGVFMVGLPDLVLNEDAASARQGNKSIGPRNTPEGFASNYQHSALYHIPQEKELPAMLIIHGATDYILDMSPAARYSARLQLLQKGERPILFLVQWEGGHATVNENEPIDILKFVLWQTGHPDFQLGYK